MRQSRRFVSWLATGLALPAAALAVPFGTRAVGAAGPTEEQRAARAIEDALQKNGPDVHRCFEQALADRLDTSGNIEVELEVQAGGKVGEAKVVAQGQEVPRALGSCVTTAAASWVIEGIEPGASVVLPFAFAGQANQFVVKASDVPERGPAAVKPKGGSKAAPFGVKILVDPENARAQHVSMTLLTVGPANRVAMHRHPRSAKILYLTKGRARVLGPTGTPPMALAEGSAVFLPPGYPHVIENMGRQAPAVFVQAFSPPGPERVYRDPTNADARADFEVIRDPRVKAPAGAKPIVVSAAEAERLSGPAPKTSARILFDEKVTGSPTMALSLVEFQPGASVPRHDHQGSTELLYVLSGGGKLTVGSEESPFAAETALHLPSGQPHAVTFGGGEPTIAIQIYAPAGPEQRFRGAAAPVAPKPASK
jgi:quercetin dioxygenase-like cupin family protein